jgi:hypothetical protein
MFRILSRVVVVSVFAVSLNILAVPAAQARPHEGNVVSASRSWVEEAVSWLNKVLRIQDKVAQQEAKKKMNRKTANSGPCIDPMGNPRPCP